MTFLVINIALMSTVVVAIVGLLAAAIHAARSESAAIHAARSESAAVAARARMPRQRPARARAYGSYESVNA